MKVSLSRRCIEKAGKRWNAKCFRGMSTASYSSVSETQRVWSESPSFTSPDSDFTISTEKLNLSINSRNDQPAWSCTLSFASPESDFVSAPEMVHTLDYATESNPATWSELLSFSSPESDFVSAPKTVHVSTTDRTNRWSESLSFASPESDFVSAPRTVHVATTDRTNRWSESLSFASPESDFVSAQKAVHESITDRTNRWSASLSFASPESDFVSAPETLNVKTMLETHSLKETLPKTMKDALNDKRPIVITTAESPFRVVDVNTAWESLCGYRREEALGRNLGSLLQGPDTNMRSANKMVRSLQENGFSESVITNYAKNGRRFKNHVQIGMIPATDDGDTSSASNDTFFVGVLNDISESSNQKLTAM